MRLSRVLAVAALTTLLVAASVLVASFPFTNPLASDLSPAPLVTVLLVAGAVALAAWLAIRGRARSTPYW